MSGIIGCRVQKEIGANFTPAALFSIAIALWKQDVVFQMNVLMKVRFESAAPSTESGN